MKILIWSMNGCGEHYGGPGMSIYRTYARNQRKSEDFLLVHGNINQGAYPLFSRTQLIRPLVGDRFQGIMQLDFIHRGKRWLKNNAGAFDVFFSPMAYHNSVAPALYASDRLNKPAFVRVATAHSDLGVKGGLKSFLGVIERRRQMIKKLDGVFAISTEIEEELRDFGVPERKIIRGGNGVDTQRFSPVTKEQKYEWRNILELPQRFTFVFSGALVRKKNPHLLLEGVKRCLAMGYDPQAVFIGPAMEPEYFQKMQAQINRDGLADRVYFRGFVNHPEDYYKAGDVFVLPSIREGMSNAMLEGAATGLPILIGAVSGAKDVVEAGKPAGRMLDLSDPNSLFNSMIEYMEAPELACEHGRNASSTIRSRFSSEVVYSRHMEVFSEAIARRRKSHHYITAHSENIV